MLVKEVKVMTVREVQYTEQLNMPEAVHAVWKALVETASWYDPDKEAFVAFLLDTHNRVNSVHLVTLGTLDASLVHAREVFRPAVVAAAHKVVLAHNHPSNDLTPSPEDLRATRELVAAGKILEVPVVDHLIITETGYLSLRERGLVDF